MNSQLQVWIPALVPLVGALIVVVLTAWWNVRTLSEHMRLLESKLDAKIDLVRGETKGEIQALRAEMKGDIQALRGEMNQGFAELRLEMHQELSELTRRLDRLEEARGLVRP